MRPLALLAAALALLGATPALARPPMWVVRDADSELVLFGAVHVLPPGLDWRPPALNRALASADDVWFELPVDPATVVETARIASRRGTLEPDQSLFRLLPPKDAERLLRVAQTYGADPAVLDRLRPWLAEVALGAAAYRKAGAGELDGVERKLAADIPPTAARRAFETPGEQIEIMAGAAEADQLAMLRETLEEMERDPDQFDVLVRAWMAGDLKAVDRDALQPIREISPDFFRRIIDDRNARWARTLDARLKGRGRTVVVVGVGHLIGPEGLPTRLRALGYRVEGP
jgi:uncharacterized protein YbaP (TraB family)